MNEQKENLKRAKVTAIAAFTILLFGLTCGVIGYQGGHHGGYEDGFTIAQKTFDLIPIIKADPSPVKVRPVLAKTPSCPPAVIVQAAPTMGD